MGGGDGSGQPIPHPSAACCHTESVFVGFRITDQGHNLGEASMGVEIRGRQLEARGRRRVTDEGCMASWCRCRCP